MLVHLFSIFYDETSTSSRQKPTTVPQLLVLVPDGIFDPKPDPQPLNHVLCPGWSLNRNIGGGEKIFEFFCLFFAFLFAFFFIYFLLFLNFHPRPGVACKLYHDATSVKALVQYRIGKFFERGRPAPATASNSLSLSPTPTPTVTSSPSLPGPQWHIAPASPLSFKRAQPEE